MQDYWINTQSKNKSQPLPHRKINLKWVIDLKPKVKTLKLPEENIEYLCDS